MTKRFSLALALSLTATAVGAQGLDYPVDVALDAKGVVFVVDHQAHALLKLEGGTFKVVAKGEGLARTPLFVIAHMALEK